MRNLYILLITSILAVASNNGAAQVTGNFLIQNESNFGIYPNPAFYQVTITIPGGKAAYESIGIYNAVGTKVFTRKITNVKNGSVKLDVSDYLRGVYFVQLSGPESKITRKLILK